LRRKQFFFEKKNQKTFETWPTWPGERTPKMTKSLLLLFFRKEDFSSWLVTSRRAARGELCRARASCRMNAARLAGQEWQRGGMNMLEADGFVGRAECGEAPSIGGGPDAAHGGWNRNSADRPPTKFSLDRPGCPD
jgi:hypothetical protein